MKNLKVAELKVIAKELGIALSYAVDGKRHTLNKSELIEAIEAKQAQQAQAAAQVETTDVQVVAETTLTDENLQYELERYWNVMYESCSMTTAEMVDAIKEYETELLAKRKRTVTTNLIVASPPKVKPIVISGENIKLNYKPNADQLEHA